MKEKKEREKYLISIIIPIYNRQNYLTKVLESYATMGFQATNMSAAIDEINRMVSASYFSISFL